MLFLVFWIEGIAVGATGPLEVDFCLWSVDYFAENQAVAMADGRLDDHPEFTFSCESQRPDIQSDLPVMNRA